MGAAPDQGDGHADTFLIKPDKSSKKRKFLKNEIVKNESPANFAGLSFHSDRTAGPELTAGQSQGSYFFLGGAFEGAR